MFSVFCVALLYSDWDLTLVSEHDRWATNKERIELLEQGFGGLQESMQRMEIRVADKLQQLEMTLERLSDILLSGWDSPSHHYFSREGVSRTNRKGADYNKPFSSKTARLEFPRIS